MRRSSSEIARRQLDASTIPHALDAAFCDQAKLVTQAAETSGCASIVMGARGFGGVEALIPGSTAYKTIYSAVVPVTVVK